MSIKKNRELMFEQIKRLRTELKEYWQPDYEPRKLNNSRLKMKTSDEIEEMIRTGKRREVKKILDKVNDIKLKLGDKYNKEQTTYDRPEIISSLSRDLVYLRAYAKLLNWMLENK